MSTWVDRVVDIVTAACVSTLVLAMYDVTVRQPRTPRIAVVDIAQLYAAADAGFKTSALARDGGRTADPSAASALVADSARGAQEFGPKLEAVLKTLSGECRCAIVAMATVIGGDATVPDYTGEAAQRMGLSLRAALRQP